MSGTAALMRLAGAALRRPRLLWLLPLVGWRFRRRHWYRRWPFLPLPSSRYLEWRMFTAFGEGTAEPAAREIERYLEWVRRMNRR